MSDGRSSPGFNDARTIKTNAGLTDGSEVCRRWDPRQNVGILVCPNSLVFWDVGSDEVQDHCGDVVAELLGHSVGQWIVSIGHLRSGATFRARKIVISEGLVVADWKARAHFIFM